MSLRFLACALAAFCFALPALRAADPALTWSLQPAATALAARATATFTVAASAPDGTTVNYQWFKNGTPLVASSRQLGVTSPTLTLLGVTVADEGLYTASATTATAGPITSTAGELTCLGSPEILVAPTAALREAGASSTLTVVARGAGTLTYQWFRGTATSPDEPISGATSASYTVANPATTHTAYYSVQVTNALGSTTTAPVLITYETRAGGLLAGTFPTFNNTVNAILPLPDGSFVVGGAFTAVTPVVGSANTAVSRLVHILANGAIEPNTTFPVANGIVNTLHRDASGRLIAAGTGFVTITRNSVSTTRRNLVRLLADGSVDTAFVGPFTTSNHIVNAIASEADGRLYLGGQFAAAIAGSGQYLARLDATTGAFDSTFVPAPGIINVRALHLRADGKLLVAHNAGVWLLNSNGSRDTSFAGSVDGGLALLPLANGDVIVATANTLYKLNSAGGVVAGFPAAPLALGNTSNIVLHPLANGDIVVSGTLFNLNGTITGHLAFLNADGSIDSSYSVGAGFNNIVNTVASDALGRLLIGGFFTSFKGSTAAGRFARIDSVATTPPDPGAPAPDAFTQFLIDAGVPAAQRGTGDDPDGDGSTNAEEFANGTNPTLGTDAKFTLVQTGAGFVRYPNRTNVASTGTSGTGLAYRLPAGTEIMVGPDVFGGNQLNPTFRGWAPTDYDPALGYLASVSTTPLPVTLNANRRLLAVMGYPLTNPLPGYTWTTGGDYLWVGTPDVFSPTGGMTARATALDAPAAETWLETTVTAPGVLTFNWRLDAVTGTLSRLNLTADGVELGAIQSQPTNFSSTGFVPATFTLTGSGPVKLRFRLVRNANTPNTAFPLASQESAYLANFVFTGPAAQTITFASLPDLAADAPPFDLTATTTASGLAVQFTVTGPATLGANNRTVTLTGAPGTVTVTATQPGNTNFLAAPAVVRTFTVNAVVADPFADYLANAGVPLDRRGANDDADSDGLANLLEYALGLAPMSADSAGQLTTEVAGGNLTFTYRRAREGLTYVVETTTNLATGASWTSAGVTQGTPDENGTVIATIPFATGQRFVRLRVTRP